jgi:hypothetical protein
MLSEPEAGSIDTYAIDGGWRACFAASRPDAATRATDVGPVRGVNYDE